MEQGPVRITASASAQRCKPFVSGLADVGQYLRGLPTWAQKRLGPRPGSTRPSIEMWERVDSRVGARASDGKKLDVLLYLQRTSGLKKVHGGGSPRGASVSRAGPTLAAKPASAPAAAAAPAAQATCTPAPPPSPAPASASAPSATAASAARKAMETGSGSGEAAAAAATAAAPAAATAGAEVVASGSSLGAFSTWIRIEQGRLQVTKLVERRNPLVIGGMFAGAWLLGVMVSCAPPRTYACTHGCLSHHCRRRA
jgi:hypothetical protein